MKRIGDTGRRSEKELAKRLGGRLTLGSGALGGDKGDIALPWGLLEGKSTIDDRYRVDYADLVKISREAAQKGTRPAFSVIFLDEKGKPRRMGSWVMIQEVEFKAMADSE